MSIITPHGGELVDRLIPPEERQEARRRARDLTPVHLNRRQISDLELIGTGAMSPLDGFMGQADYERVVDEARLASGLPWSIPVALAVREAEAASARVGEEIALVDDHGDLLGLLELREKFSYDKKREAQEVYRTTEEAHPGVRVLYAQGDMLLAGPIRLLEPPAYQDYGPYHLSPTETRQAFRNQGWRTVVGFQTRNPVHRAHEYIQKCALEVVDGLLLHPLVGETKQDDIPAETRLRCIPKIVSSWRFCRRRCVMPALVKPFFMRSSEKITGVPISSSAEIMPGWETITAPSMPTQSFGTLPPKSWGSPRFFLIMRFIAGVAREWLPPRPVRMALRSE